MSFVAATAPPAAGERRARAAARVRQDRSCANRDGTTPGRGALQGRQKRISESSASAILPPSPTADATAIAAARSALPADQASPAPHARYDSRALSIRAE